MKLKKIDLLRNEYYERMLKVTELLNNPNIKKLIDFIFWDNAFFWSINQDDATYDLDINEDFNKCFSFFVKKDNIAVCFNSWGTKKNYDAVKFVLIDMIIGISQRTLSFKSA